MYKFKSAKWTQKQFLTYFLAVGIAVILVISWVIIGVQWGKIKELRLVSSQQSGVSQSELASGYASSSPNENQGYILKLYQNKLCVFKEGSSTPMETYDITADRFTPYDQELLKEGLAAADEQALRKLLEDYTS